MKNASAEPPTSAATPVSKPQTELRFGLLAPLALTSFIGLLNGFALGPFLPSISDDIGVSVPVLGQVATITFLMTAVGGLFVGPLADQLGHRRMILVGLITTIISAGGTALAPGFTLLLITRMIGGIGGSIASGVPLAIAGSRFAGDARRRALSIITATVAAGAVVGAPLLTSIGAFLSWRFAFGFVSVVAVISLVAFAIYFPREGQPPDARIPSLGSLLDAYMPLLQNRVMVLLFGAALLQAIAWTGPFTYLGAFFEEELGFTTREIGYGYMSTGAGFFVGSLLGGGRMRGIPLVVVFTISTISIGVFWALILATGVGPYLTIGMLATLTMVGGIGRVAFTTLLANVSPAGSGTTMVLNSSTITLGAALGSLLGGLLIGFGGFALLGIGLPAFAFSAAVILLIARRNLSPDASPAASL
jgi:predicted MFS family arabinose efflux permease